MSDTIDREMAQNEARTIPAEDREERTHSVTETVEDAVSTFARPLSDARPSAEDAERHRLENDAEQRG